MRRLTDNRVYDVQPAWSPSGTRLAYSSVRGGRQDIYVMKPNGTAVRALTRTLGFGHSPAWQPVRT
jgi:TolB protein